MIAFLSNSVIGFNVNKKKDINIIYNIPYYGEILYLFLKIYIFKVQHKYLTVNT